MPLRELGRQILTVKPDQVSHFYALSNLYIVSVERGESRNSLVESLDHVHDATCWLFSNIFIFK